MWDIHTAWFDVAVVMSIFAVGNILFGHFEEHKPKLRRVLKVVVVVGITVGLSLAGLRWVAYTLIGIMGSSPRTCTSGGCQATASVAGRVSRERNTTSSSRCPGATGADRRRRP